MRFGFFSEEAKPTYCLVRVRAAGRFVVRFVAITRLTCFRRKVLLGRNLITLFSGVNSFAKKFRGIDPSPTAGDTPVPSHPRPRVARIRSRFVAKRKKKSAFFPKIFRMPVAPASRARRSRMARAARRRHRRRHKPRLTRARKKVVGLGVAQRPETSICANFAPPRRPRGRHRRLRAMPSRTLRTHPRTRKNPRLSARVPVACGAVARRRCRPQCSSSSSSAA